jgi:hypothetical protein
VEAIRHPPQLYKCEMLLRSNRERVCSRRRQTSKNTDCRTSHVYVLVRLPSPTNNIVAYLQSHYFSLLQYRRFSLPEYTHFSLPECRDLSSLPEYKNYTSLPNVDISPLYRIQKLLVACALHQSRMRVHSTYYCLTSSASCR